MAGEGVRRRVVEPTARVEQKETILTVDMMRWPIVVVTYAGKPSFRELSDHLREVEDRVLFRRLPFVQIVDQTRGEIPDALQRALIADHQARMEHLYKRFCVGEAYVCSPQMHSAMIAVFWQSKPPYPYIFLDTMPEAMTWARAHWAESMKVRG